MKKVLQKVTHWILRRVTRRQWVVHRGRERLLNLGICLNHRISRFSPFMQVAIDELEAVGLGRALLRHCPEIGSLRIYDAKEAARVSADIVIVKWPDYPPLNGSFYRKVFWLKNPGWANRIREFQKQFDVIFSASKVLCDRCPELVYLPVACPDPSMFRLLPPQSRFQSEVCFVGNYAKEGRPPEHVEKYLVPATQFKFALWGVGWETAEQPVLRSLSRGRLRPGLVPLVYASSHIILLNHGASHHQEDMIATRVFEALACEAFVISDHIPSLKTLSQYLVFTTGGEDLREKIRYFLARPEERRAKVQGARAFILQYHTMIQRARCVAETLGLRWVGSDES